MSQKPRFWSDEVDITFDMMRSNLQERNLQIDKMVEVVASRESLNKEIHVMYEEIKYLQEVDTIIEVDRILVALSAADIRISKGMHFLLSNCLRHGRLKRIDVLYKRMEFLLNEPLAKPATDNKPPNGPGGVQLPDATLGKDSGGDELRRKRSVRRKSKANPVRTPRRANSSNAKKGAAEPTSD